LERATATGSTMGASGACLLALGAALCAALWLTGAASADPDWPRRFVTWFAAGWVCYLVASLAISRVVRPPRWTLLWIVAVALAARVVSLERTPPLSTDVWRYVWDGRIAAAGINPYRYAPSAKELARFRDQNWGRINYPDIPTIYPPAAELLFAGSARVSAEAAEPFRWSFLALDMGTILLLARLLRRTGHAPERVIWYAWCPLSVTEVAAGAHVDAMGLFLLVLALLLAAGGPGRTRASGVVLAGAVLSKGFALFTVPFFLRRDRRWDQRTCAAFLGTCGLLLAPFLAAGRHLFGGLTAYVQHWQTNASFFSLCDWLLARSGVGRPYAVSRVVSLVLLVAVVGWLVRRQGSGAEARIVSSFTALGALALLGAPVFPWYVIWSLPLLCWRWVPAWALLSMTVSVQYYLRWRYHALGIPLLWAGYLPVYALLVGQVIWTRWHALRSNPCAGA
jgi:alpha-1,6-mannosyltransferase